MTGPTTPEPALRGGKERSDVIGLAGSLAGRLRTWAVALCATEVGDESLKRLVAQKVALLREGAAELERLEALRARLAARLEIDHLFTWDAAGDELRVEVPPAEQEAEIGHVDGIACRDETIRQQDRLNAGLRDRLHEARSALASVATVAGELAERGHPGLRPLVQAAWEALGFRPRRIRSGRDDREEENDAETHGPEEAR